MNKILIILPVLGDTKDSKRIKLLKEAGFIVNVAYYERKEFETRKPEADSFILLGKVYNKKYLIRVIIFIKSFFKLRKLIKENDLVYCIGADLAILAYFSAKFLDNKKFIIDIADIREIQVSDLLISKLLRFIETYVTKRASLVVVTSKGFIDNYYNAKLGLTNMIFFLLENKVDYDIDIKTITENKKTNKITLGYLGMIRDEWTLLFLEKLINKYPEKFDCIIAGIIKIDNFDINKFVSKNRGIKYYGPFQSPGDLPKLYKEIDVNLIFYPEMNSSMNWFEIKRICRSNRFYESLYFKKPIVSFSFTYDGIEIDKFQIGLTLEDYDLKKSIDIVERELTIEKIQFWRNNINSLSFDTFMFMNDSKILGDKLQEIILKD
jgi:hypothetical protein